jgi:hypothetical protein
MKDEIYFLVLGHLWPILAINLDVGVDNLSSEHRSIANPCLTIAQIIETNGNMGCGGIVIEFKLLNEWFEFRICFECGRLVCVSDIEGRGAILKAKDCD